MNDLGKDKENYYKIFPGFDYNQWFESINYFTTNIIPNEQVQLLIKDVYNDNLKDSKIKIAVDTDKEVIKIIDNKLSLLLTENDIQEVKNYFNTIKIGNCSFEEWCNLTSWDKGKIAE